MIINSNRTVIYKQALSFDSTSFSLTSIADMAGESPSTTFSRMLLAIRSAALCD